MLVADFEEARFRAMRIQTGAHMADLYDITALAGRLREFLGRPESVPGEGYGEVMSSLAVMLGPSI